jgi:hypothetical protein
VVTIAQNDTSKKQNLCYKNLIDIKAGERLSRFHLRVRTRRVSSKRVCACLLTRHLQIRTRSSRATGSVSYTHTLHGTYRRRRRCVMIALDLCEKAYV